MGAEEPVSLALLLRDIERLQEVVSQWDEQQRNTVTALEQAMDALQTEAFRRMLRGLSRDPACAEHLRALAGDEVIYAVLRHHGLLKASLQEQVETALEQVRPMLHQHGGDVHLIEVKAPDSVTLQLTGACDGCPSQAITLSDGIEKAIRQHCPEIQHIRTRPSSHASSMPVDTVSPFFRESGWYAAAELESIPDGGVLACSLAGHELLLTRRGDLVSCFDNACAHQGLALDTGAVVDGVLTCPHHGFRYHLDDGSCESAPGVALMRHPVRLLGTTLEVRLH